MTDDFDTAVRKIARRNAISFFVPRLAALTAIIGTFVFFYVKAAL